MKAAAASAAYFAERVKAGRRRAGDRFKVAARNRPARTA
jgi:hypothetical protein